MSVEQHGLGVLSVEQEERLRSLRQMVRIEIDGDWDEPMIQAVFNELEKVLGVGDPGNGEDGKEGKKGNARSGRRRGRK